MTIKRLRETKLREKVGGGKYLFITDDADTIEVSTFTAPDHQAAIEFIAEDMGVTDVSELIGFHRAAAIFHVDSDEVIWNLQDK
jgi:hypothetical protein